MYSRKSIDIKGSYYFESIDYTTQNYTYLAEVSTINRDITPILVNTMNEAIIRKITGKTTANIDVTVHPFPNTVGKKKFSKTISGFVTAFVYSLAISFMPASIITFIVKERED